MSYRILMVEDSRADIELSQYAFSQLATPPEITVAKDGVEALDYLDEHGGEGCDTCPNLILLDLGLPRLNGYQVLESVKANAVHEHIPVVVLSSSDAQLDVQRSYRLHASSYITKPVGLQGYQELARKIEQYWFDAVTLPPC